MDKKTNKTINKEHLTWLAVGRLLLKHFHLHEKTQYAELVFLLLGIVYFVEAIVKNTLEMLRHVP